MSNPSSSVVNRLLEEAERALKAGQPTMAEQRLIQILALEPDQPRALALLAMRAAATNDLPKARELIERAAAASPRSALVEAQRGSILLALGEREAALAALASALQLDPGFVPVRFDLAALLEDAGRSREAAEHYRAALSHLPSPPPAMFAAQVERAQRALAREQAELESLVRSHLARLGPIEDDSRQRFDECYEIFFGRRKPMQPRPGMMYFPKLPPLTFFPREMFDWVARVEAQTDVVRAEIEALLSQGGAGFMPYVQKPDHEAGRAFQALNHNADWGACFLYNQGERVARHCDACPATTALLDSLPLVRIPARGPTAFFSRLKPGTHIVPHHGATNTRLIAHLPLIVPEGCALRVGNDTRPVEAGRMMIFDDSIEHEAWNRGSSDRIVLIFDIWNPFLSAAERELVTAITAAVAEFHPERLHRTDF